MFWGALGRKPISLVTVSGALQTTVRTWVAIIGPPPNFGGPVGLKKTGSSVSFNHSSGVGVLYNPIVSHRPNRV
jgi:hypothetical protein